MRASQRIAIVAGVSALVLAFTTTTVTNSAQGAASTRPSATDGQILYEVHDPAIDDLIAYAVNPDGTGVHQLYDQPMECPHWSPDGSRVASCGGPGDSTTTILNVDTGAARFLPSVAPNLITPCYVWSSDGSRLACEAFNDDDPSRNGIFTVRVADWGDVHRLTTNNGAGDVPGDYSPNSRQLVFSRTSADTGGVQLFRINSNGTGLRRLTPVWLLVGSSGSWSPRGNEILFSAHADADHRQSLWLVHSDGTGLRQVAVAGIPCGGAFDDTTSIGCADPAWSPTGDTFAFRRNAADGTAELWTAHADGGDPRRLVDLGFDPGESIDWGVHLSAVVP